MIQRPRILARDLCVTYGTQAVLNKIELDVAPESFVGIVGPSGCGKSTLLRCVASLVNASEGQLVLNMVHSAERDVSSDPVRIAFVFQHANLLPWRDVLGNIALPLELQQAPRARRIAEVRSVAEMVGLAADDVHKLPRMLSGGMQMRVSLARALVTDPQVLLLDEPFAALDDILRQQLNEELLRLWQAKRWTTLFVTHNVSEAVFLSQRVIVLSRRPGRIADLIEIPFSYPRSPELRESPEFAILCGRLAASLRRVSA